MFERHHLQGLFCSKAVWLVCLLVVAGCAQGVAESSPAPSGRQGQGNQGKGKGKSGRPVKLSTGQLTLEGLQAADGYRPRPRKLPTISAIDWTAFPSDLDGAYGKSGRRVVLKPGKAGVVAAALERAKPGDLILLEGGTYKEGAQGEDGALRIQKEGLVLRSLPGQRARIIPSSAASTRGLLIEADNVLVAGLDLDGFLNMAIGIGKEEETVSGTILSDITVKGPKQTEWVDGIVVWPDLRGQGKPAVKGLLIRNTKVEQTTLGISCNSGPCDGLWLENVLVSSSSGSGSGADSIAVESGKNVVLVGVETTGATADGIDLKAAQVLVMNSHVHHVARNGIKLWQGGDVINTLVHNTGADASFAFEDGHYRLLNCTMAYHNYKGPRSYNITVGYGHQRPAKVELINSIFYNTSGGMYFSDHTALTVSNCLFHGMQNGSILRARAKGREVFIETRSKPKAFELMGLGRNNLLQDPKFVDPVQGNFMLQSQSPALDRGIVSKPFPRRDLAGKPRLRGKGPDLGAFECR